MILEIKLKNQNVLINSINYLNNTAFSINNEVLNFILDEWINENSNYFKGANKLLNINKNDSKEDKAKKQSHNSKYWRYLNTIKLATI